MAEVAELPEEITEVFEAFDTSMDVLEEKLNTLLELVGSPASNRLSPFQKAKLDLLVAYTANTLFFRMFHFGSHMWAVLHTSCIHKTLQ